MAIEKRDEELDELFGTSTSANIAELDQWDDDNPEFPSEQPDEQTIKLLEEVEKFAPQFKSLNKQIEQWRPTLIALKQKFGVKQGHEGKRIVVDGHGIFWNEYCQLKFDLTAHRLNQLIADKDKQLGTVTTRPDSEKPLFLKGYRQAKEDLAKAKPAEASVPVSAEPEKKAAKQAPVATEKSEPYFHFQQFTDEVETYTSEMAAMQVELMDESTDARVVTLFAKQLKQQRRELAKAKSDAA